MTIRLAVMILPCGRHLHASMDIRADWYMNRHPRPFHFHK